jgi:2,4-dienoyl-CoA reductase-like NADH-dependent reductase (Old Yellow Enzyme family)
LTEFNDPLILSSGQVIKNRFCKAAMTERVAGPDNFACERHHKIYEKWARSGSGILLTGNVQIDRSCMEGPANVCIEEHSYQNQMPALKKWAEVSETDGSKLWMQISHAGRQTPGELNKEPLAPSSTPLKMPGRNFGTPKAMTEEEILDVIKRFAFVAKIAREANFSGIQLHSAHGYLLSEFLSPDINQRTDAWGDSLENRARIHLEIIKACRKAVGDDFPISMKMNSADFQKGGFSHEESIQVAKMVSDAGLDLLEISGGTYEKPSLLGYDNVGMNPKRMEKRKESTIAREAYFLEYADDIKKAISIPLMVTGGFRSRTGINAALANNACEVIGIGRPLCADPYSLQKMINGEIDQLPDYEKTLSVGPGWLSSRSPFRLIQAINALSSQAWFYLQINKMGKGEDPDLAKRPFAAFREIAKIDSAAFKKFSET